MYYVIYYNNWRIVYNYIDIYIYEIHTVCYNTGTPPKRVNQGRAHSSHTFGNKVDEKGGGLGYVHVQNIGVLDRNLRDEEL